MEGTWEYSSRRSCCISFSATLGSERSSREATLSRRRKKPPSPPTVTSVVHLVRAVVGRIVGDSPPTVMAVVELFPESVVLAKVLFVSWLLFTAVRWI